MRDSDGCEKMAGEGGGGVVVVYLAVTVRGPGREGT